MIAVSGRRQRALAVARRSWSAVANGHMRHAEDANH
jgi:hypothetical protein